MKAMFPMIDDIEILKTLRKCKGRHNNVVDILVRMSQRIEKKNDAAKRQCEKMRRYEKLKEAKLQEQDSFPSLPSLPATSPTSHSCKRPYAAIVREPKEKPNPVTGFDFGAVSLEAIGPDGHPVQSKSESHEPLRDAEALPVGLSPEQKECNLSDLKKRITANECLLKQLESDLLASEAKVISMSTQCEQLHARPSPHVNHNGTACNSASNSFVLNEGEIIQNLKSLIGREILRSSSTHPNPLQMERQLKRNLALSLLEDAFDITITERTHHVAEAVYSHADSPFSPGLAAFLPPVPSVPVLPEEPNGALESPRDPSCPAPHPGPNPPYHFPMFPPFIPSPAPYPAMFPFPNHPHFPAHYRPFPLPFPHSPFGPNHAPFPGLAMPVPCPSSAYHGPPQFHSDGKCF